MMSEFQLNCVCYWNTSP